MIKTRTLFILGTGASAPFDYPTSTELRDYILNGGFKPDIVKRLTDNDDFYAELHNKEFDKLIEKFSGSGRYSIDSFLEHNPGFMDIGKICIAPNLDIF